MQTTKNYLNKMTMNFRESLDYLNSLGYETLVMEFGLEKTSHLLSQLNNPQNNFLKIQVVGTNGKGSVCSFLDSICRSANIKTGLYTSPNIFSITERIKVDNNEISEERFAYHTTLVHDICEKLLKEKVINKIPTFFEQLTAIAISTFAEEKVELAILETGLGGRLDSVTATNAEIIGITIIDFDHQEYLGNNLTDIAGEKAAVIRFSTQKVVVSKQLEEAEKIILERCKQFGIMPKKTDFMLPDYKLGLAGKHQIENAKVAILLAENLQEKFSIKTKDIAKGLQTAKHRGRLEFYKNILFDGAHNVGGAKSLRDYLDEFVKQPIVMIFGLMKEKDLTEIAEILFTKANKLILTKPDNPRAMEVSELIKFVPDLFPKANLFLSKNVSDALKKSKEISTENDLILVTGSLYLVGEVQKILKNDSEL